MVSRLIHTIALREPEGHGDMATAYCGEVFFEFFDPGDEVCELTNITRRLYGMRCPKCDIRRCPPAKPEG